jgi:glyoxylase-like metal-dependent hydrolase (beta-lactamase superfamily II)
LFVPGIAGLGATPPLRIFRCIRVRQPGFAVPASRLRQVAILGLRDQSSTGVSMRRLLLMVAFLLSTPAQAAVTAAPWNAPWDAGADDCAKHPHPPLEVHRYDGTTFVLREDLCATWEAPFMYLLIGAKEALLIDTGDVAEAQKMPLAQTVSALVAQYGAPGLPLLVVHTHRHLDHRAGDVQFAKLPNAKLVGYDIDSVKAFYGFRNWPNGMAHLDLGNRIVDVMPAPGHNETHVVFYDRKTSLLFSGDFLLPGRLLVDDAGAELESANRVADFVRNRPVAAVLGGHVEIDSAGETFPWESTFHPREHELALTKAEVLALPAALQSFNGFYTQSGKFLLMNPMRNLLAVASAATLLLAGVVAGLILVFRRWRRARRRLAAAAPSTSGR